MIPRQPFADCSRFVARLRQRDVGRQPAEDRNGELQALGLVGVPEDERHPRLHAAGRKAEAVRHHAHHAVRAAVQEQAAVEHIARAPKLALPERMAHHDDAVAARFGLVAPKRAAERCLDAQELEELGRHQAAREPPRLALSRERELDGAERRQPLEAAPRPTQVEEVRRRQRVAWVGRPHRRLPSLLRVQLGDGHQALELGERIGPQQQGVNEAVDRRIGADAERERERGREREDGAARECPHRLPRVLHQAVDEEDAAGLVEPLLGRGHVAERPPRQGLGFGRRNTLAAQAVGLELQVRRDLGLEVAGRPLAAPAHPFAPSGPSTRATAATKRRHCPASAASCARPARVSV